MPERFGKEWPRALLTQWYSECYVSSLLEPGGGHPVPWARGPAVMCKRTFQPVQQSQRAVIGFTWLYVAVYSDKDGIIWTIIILIEMCEKIKSNNYGHSFSRYHRIVGSFRDIEVVRSASPVFELKVLCLCRSLPFTPEFGVRFPVSAVWKKQIMFLPHPRVKVSIAGSLRDREVACSASDRQGSNFESCVWGTVSSQSSHHPQEVLLAQFSLYVHKGGLKPDLFHFHFDSSL